MPLIIKCSKCGRIFYYGMRLLSIKKIMKGFLKCDKCGREIKIDPEKIKIIIN